MPVATLLNALLVKCLGMLKRGFVLVVLLSLTKHFISVPGTVLLSDLLSLEELLSGFLAAHIKILESEL